ncbi:MAG: VCBS repeat-containing protein [Plectolyngbya sp. WJT66-NPBG17]|jgi:RHS repeat-associated protein|nr:VCBS repeat-containing protein [Plectolyngbya sp. WJT66-NPBG17]
MNKQVGKSDSTESIFSTKGGRTEPDAIEVPKIELPKGGGAVRGIDEEFKVNAANGTASFSIPLPVAASRGVVPKLRIAYSSGGGNSIFGLGWDLGLPTIKRKTSQELPQYLDGKGDAPDSDTFLLAGAEDLVAEFNRDAFGAFIKNPDGTYQVREHDSPDGNFIIRRYKPRVEGVFSRIERWTHKTTGETRWRVISPDNITTLLGWSNQSRIADPANERRVYEWLPEFVYDDRGNCSQYVYRSEDDTGFDSALPHHANRRRAGQLSYTNRYLSHVLYGNRTPFGALNDPFPADGDYMFETAFDYGEYDLSAPFDAVGNWNFRDDAFSDYKPGFELRTTRLCRRVLQWHHFPALPGGKALVQSLDLTYDTSTEQNFTYLAAVTTTGYAKRADGSYTHKRLPPFEFSYQAHAWNKTVATVSQENVAHAPTGIASPYLFTDLYSEGLSGILTEQADGWYYKRNLGGGTFTRAHKVSPKPSFSGLGQQLTLTDLDTDGTKQLVHMTDTPKGFFELDSDLPHFQAFKQVPNVDTNDPYTRLIDLTGDGKPDLLITEDQVFTWYESQGRDGFGPARKTPKPLDEEAGPAIVFADSKQSIFLADMDGDGLTDIVRVRHSDVCYWPNLGHGRFGSRIVMGRPPVCDAPDAFSAARIRLADIDGSGTNDIIYLGKRQISCWLNLSGNAFAGTPIVIDAFPELHNQADISVTDLMGTGTSCIVWSSPLDKDRNAPLRYIDLMSSRKPHLMTGYRNNLGKQVLLDYTPSTRFYIEDEQAGHPWSTKLHFPVQCLSRVETIDHVSGHRLVNHYRYRHGYYDHAEREFRGFGMSEKRDAEQFEHWVLGGATNTVDKTLHQAPVVTRSWFHTGSMIDQHRLFGLFAADFWYNELARQGFPVTHHELALPNAKLIAAPGVNPALVTALSAQQWRQAMRSCRSMPLRSEVFALDAPATGATPTQLEKQLTPFAVTTNNCIIELLQPQGQNRHAIFTAKESEVLTYQYERNPEEARVSHTLNLQFDEYGNVLESAKVAYPRRIADPALPSDAAAAQAQTFISYRRARFTDDRIAGDNHRLRVPSEEHNFELRGVQKAGAYYMPHDFNNILALAADTPYRQFDNAPPPGAPEKRLIEHLRITYYNDGLSGPLLLHQQGERGFEYETYHLAYTPDLLNDIYGGKATNAIMLEGRYIDPDGDAHWWVRSGTLQYKLPAETAADAEDRFCQPISYTDPFGGVTKVTYLDNLFLFIGSTEDAVGNITSIEHFDYRTLTVQRLKDHNDNLSEAIADELGMVKATALLGKGAEADDLAGLSEFTTPAEETAIADFFNAANSTELVTRGKALLAHATTRFVYDLTAFQTSGSPVVAASILREEHFKNNPDSAVMLSFEYSDGFNRVVMKKGQAEPGLAKQVTPGSGDSVTIVEVDTTPDLRWVGTGRTVVNNKGNAVKKYEPYFSVTHRFESHKELVESGVTPLFYHDALNRLVKTVLPDGTLSTTSFNAWQQLLYEQGDTVTQSSWYTDRAGSLIDGILLAEGKDPAKEKTAALDSANYDNTPSILDFDTLGRPVLQTQHNRLDGIDSFYRSFMKLDIEGCLRHVIDARGNTVMRYKYDLTGSLAWQQGADSGQRWTLENIAELPLRSWDERNHTFAHSYDALGRVLQRRVLGGDGSVALNHIYERNIYGETQPNAKTLNLRGQPVRTYDTGGMVEVQQFNFKGQPLASHRRLFAAYKDVPDWSDANLAVGLEPDVFTTALSYDALGRTVQTTLPDGDIEKVVFNAAGLIERKTVTHNAAEDTVIGHIDYNAKGQRIRMELGNGVVNTYRYDRQTFTLIRLTSRKSGGELLQDLRFTFDAVGNVSHIEDRAIPLQFFNNQMVSGTTTYRYDAIYRLAEATGRENNAVLSFGAKDNWNDSGYLHDVNAGDPAALRNYTQFYSYDPLGNITRMRHQASGNNWTRDYNYAAVNNRMLSTTQGMQVYNYGYHPQHGFINAMPHLEDLGWDFKEKLVRTVRQKVISGTPETTYYQYSADGTRLRKITENAAPAGQMPTQKEERVYIGAYERYRKFSGNHAGLVRHGLNVNDTTGRLALIETRNGVNDGTDPRRMRYQLANHLSSVNLEVDDFANVISYEEYHPYGTTAYQARNTAVKVAAKRYRYTGRERDEESGLEYHVARYYLPWLGRWLSPDPIGTGDGLNVYRYAKDNPGSFNDTNGNESEEQKASRLFEDFLKEQGVNYRKEVPFKVEVNGKWVEGRADFFVETKDGWKPVEMKGKANSPWTKAQEKYLPALQSGAKFETIGTSKFSTKVSGSGGGQVLNVHTVATGKYDFQKEVSTSYIKRPKGDASKGEKITVTKDVEGNVLREKREPFTSAGTKSSSPEIKVEVKEPHVKVTDPKVHFKEPHVKVKGKGLILAVIVGGITYLVTNDAYAAGQSINPAAETTDAVVEGKGAGGVTWGVVKDIWYLTPAGWVHATGQLAWDLNQAAMAASHFPVPEGWVDQMAAEGRNPFCALCHDPRGPLSEAARERAIQEKKFDQFNQFKFNTSEADTEALIRRFIQAR